MFKKINKNYSYKFTIKEDNLYVINIEASCESGKMFGLFGGEDLKIEIDDIKFREIPAVKNTQCYNIPPSWNGTELKGQSKIIYFVLYLKKGDYNVNFIPRRGAEILTEPTVKVFNQGDKIIENKVAEDGDRRPWITIVLVNLPLNILDVSATCKKRGRDSDDLKLIIDGRIEKNKQSSWWGKNWLWQGHVLNGNIKEARFYPKLKSDIHYIEFWADRMPILKAVKLDLGFENKLLVELEQRNLQDYKYKGIGGNENYNRYNGLIISAVDKWNDKFSNDKYPVKERLDPNLVKAIIYQESKVGYYPGGEIDVMQVGNPGDPALRTLNGELEEWWMEYGKEVRLNYNGDANANTVEQSIDWGVRWLYHKAQGIKDGERYWRTWKDAVFRYGPNTQKYVDNVWQIYEKGIDKSKKRDIVLWSVVLLLLVSTGVASWFYNNQGRVYIKYIDNGKGDVCVREVRPEIGILDGLKIKKAVIDLVDDEELGSCGLEKDSILVDYYDLDNDGEDEVLVSARYPVKGEVMYFFEIGRKSLERIKIIDDDVAAFNGDKLEAWDVRFGQRDERGRYTFFTENIIYSVDGSARAWRSYYGFNNDGNMEVTKREKNVDLAVN